jgi:type I restriction enzyme S subunit
VSTATIGALTKPIKTWNPVSKPDEDFAYVDLSAVDNQSKAIISPTTISGSEAPSRARQLVAAGDVLVSTVRPNLNAVAMVPDELDGATASTGFTVLRPRSTLDGRYLFHWVRSTGFIDEMVRKATGASYPAVSDRIIKESPIPAPALPEQRRIAAILDHADAIRAKRRQVLAHLDTLTQSIFSDMFGDPEAATKTVPFREIAVLSGGRNLVAADSDSDSAYRVLKISSVTSGQFKAWESKPLPEGYVPPPAHLVRPGDLLMSRANTTDLVGAVALVHDTPPNLALPDKVWRFTWHDPASVPLFYHALFHTSSIRRRISRLSSGTGGSMKNVSKAKLESMQLPRVSLSKQREFAARIDRVNAQRLALQRARCADDNLFASLQSRAFRGEH